MRKVWTENEKKFIREHIDMKDEEVLENLIRMSGRKISLASLRKQRQRLGFYKVSGRGLSKLRIKQENINGI